MSITCCVVQFDRVYLSTPSKVAIVDHSKHKTVVLVKEGLPDAGKWMPLTILLALIALLFAHGSASGQQVSHVCLLMDAMVSRTSCVFTVWICLLRSRVESVERQGKSYVRFWRR